MKNKQRKVGEHESPVLRAIPEACKDELAAVEFMEKQRWGNTPACPRCGAIDVVQVKDGNGNRNKRFLWRCHSCKDQFTVRIGTVFEDSRIPLRIWCYAFWKACSSKKGISALQIKRECGLAYKSALFLMHRIRFAMTPDTKEKLSGDVEVDETYVGGKPRYKGERVITIQGLKMKIGTGKTPVLALISRNGSIRTKVLPDVTGKTLRTAIMENVNVPSARLLTDELTAYKKIGKEFSGGHESVTHSKGEYARGDIHSNTAESFFATLKRGIYGTFHAVSKKHLHRYVNEFAFRWDTRKIDDGERLVTAIKGADGKRLLYKEPIIKTV
jgi:transposase-like protein